MLTPTLHSLIRPYKREMYLYDLYDMSRRIMFVSILPLLPGSESNRACIGCILALLALMISVNLKPYGKEVLSLTLRNPKSLTLSPSP